MKWAKNSRERDQWFAFRARVLSLKSVHKCKIFTCHEVEILNFFLKFFKDLGLLLGNPCEFELLTEIQSCRSGAAP